MKTVKELQTEIDGVVEKLNPYHDPATGRFTTAAGAGGKFAHLPITDRHAMQNLTSASDKKRAVSDTLRGVTTEGKVRFLTRLLRSVPSNQKELLTIMDEELTRAKLRISGRLGFF